MYSPFLARWRTEQRPVTLLMPGHAVVLLLSVNVSEQVWWVFVLRWHDLEVWPIKVFR